MSEVIPAEEHEAFSTRQDRRVVATVLWRRDAIVGIVVVRRRNGRSALIPVPEVQGCAGFALDPLLNGEEPAECGNLRAFGGVLMCVDIGEFETQKPRLLN